MSGRRGIGRGLALASCCLAAAVGTGTLRAQAGDPASASDPFVRAFRDPDGLPQNTVHALALDRDGLLWAGTQDGLARYDGRDWVRDQPPGIEGALFVRDLLARHDGELWVATQAGGLLRRAAGRWQEIPDLPADLARARVNALAETLFGSEETLWVGTHDRGLFALGGGAWRHFDENDGLPSNRVWSLLGAQAGTQVWIGTQRGVAAIDPASGAVSRPDGAPVTSVSSLEWTVERGVGTLWAGTYGDGLHRLSGSRWSQLGREDGLPSMFVTDLAPRLGEPGQIWIATDGGGLAWADLQAVHRFDVGSQFASKAAYRLLETSETEGAEALWVGTRNGGLLRVTDRLWRTLAPPAEAPPTPITALEMVASGDGGEELWVGTDGEGLAVWRAGNWWRPRLRPGDGGDPAVLALRMTSRVGAGRRHWVGMRNAGLAAWDGEHWASYTAAAGDLPSDLVQALAEVPAGRGEAELWAGTREGLAIFDGRNWRTLRLLADATGPSVQALAVENLPGGGAPAVWVGTSNGLWRVRGDKIRHWGLDEGLPHRSVQALWIGATGKHGRALWIGTDGGGLARLDPQQLDSPLRTTREQGVPRLHSPVVYALVADGQGRLYASTNQGIARFRPEASEDGREEVETFSIFHGLPVHQGSRGAAIADAQGRIWFGTVGGIALLDPARESPDTTPNRLLVEATLPRRDSAPLAPGGRLSAGEAEIAFSFRLLSFVGEPLTRYRTELVGVDPAPMPWTARAEREVVALVPGDYLLRVWGRDAAGNVSAPVEFAFAVLPEPWQTAWFQLLAGLLALGAGALLVRHRVRRHQARERELEAQVAERTAQLQEANAQLARLSFLDSLTEIGNRRRFDDQLEIEWRRAARGDSPLAVVMIDIDEFKPFNDTHGHPRGDEVLRQVADLLAHGLSRSGDLLARYGGEEFAVLLPATDEEGAYLLAESLRVHVSTARIAHGASKVAEYVTVSCGVAAARPPLSTGAREVVSAADQALYVAKRAGRNRTARASH